MADKTSNIYINGQQAEKTLRQLRADSRRLNNELQQLVPGTDEYLKKMQELGKTRNQLAEHSRDVRNVGEAMAKTNKSAADRLAELNERMRSGTLDARQMQRALVEYQSIALEAGRTSPIGREAINQAAAYQDELSKLRNEITALADDGFKMQAGIQIGQTALAGYSLAQAGAAALGVENEKLQETFVKLQASTTALNAVEQIRRNLERDKAMMIALNIARTKVLTATTAAYAVVVGSTNGVLRAFRLALAATGIGAIIVGLGLLITNWDKVTGTVKNSIKWIRDFIDNSVILRNAIKLLMAPINALIKALEWLGIIESEAKKQIRETQRARSKAIQEQRKAEQQRIKERIQALQDEQKAVDDQLDFEIKKRRALGKETADLERERMQNVIASSNAQIKAINELIDAYMAEIKIKMQTGQFTTEERKNIARLIEDRNKLADTIKKTNQDIELFEINQAKAREKRAQDAADSELKQRKEFLKSLEELKQKERELNEEANRQFLLASKNAQDAEITQLEWAIEEKYKKDLELARKLAAQKGDIGVQGAERLATLEALMEQELAESKLKINQKYLEEKQKQEAEEAAKRFEVQQKIEDAQFNARKNLLQVQLSELNSDEFEARKKLLAEITALEISQAEIEFQRKQDELERQLDAELITREEFHAIRLEQETEFELLILDIRRKSADEQIKVSEEVWQRAQFFAQQAIMAIDAMQNARFERDKARVDDSFNHESQALQRQLRSGEIDREQYDKRLEVLERQKAKREHQIALEQFKAEQRMNILKAAINTAQAVLQAIAMFGPPPSPAGIAGISTAGVIGGAQIAAITSQRPPAAPQFYKGGYTVTGATDGKTYNAKWGGRPKAGMIPGGTQMVLVNEKKPEYFIPNPLLSDPRVIDHVRAIEGIRLRQFNDGGFTAQSTASTPVDVETTVDNSQELMIQAIKENSEATKALIHVLTNFKVVIGDDKIDDIFERYSEIEDIRN